MLNRKVAPINFSFTLPEIKPAELYKLKNGIDIYSTSDKKLDILKIDIYFENANCLTEKITGLNLITSKSILSGTSTKSAEDIANIVASLGAFIDISSSFDYSALTVYCLEQNVIDTISLISEVLENQKFSEEELELQKNIVSSNLQIQEQKNNVIASRALRKTLYGDHFYGSSPTISLVKSINQEDIISNFLKNWKMTSIFISGNVTDRAIQSLELLNCQQKITSIFEPSILNIIKSSKNHASIKNRDSIQTSIRFGRRIIGRTHKDYAYLALTNYILGGFFGSRLMSNLREQKGLTYGVHSSLTTFKYDAFFAIQCDVKTNDKTLAIEEIKNELEILSTKRITKNELQLAKNHYLGSFQNSLSSIYSLSSKHKNMHLYGLRKDYYSCLIESINKIHVYDVLSCAQKYLSPKDMKIITVGG